MVEFTSIRITTETRDKLKSRGMKGESYDDIIAKIMKILDKKK